MVFRIKKDLALVLMDIVSVMVAYFLALWLRFECSMMDMEQYCKEGYLHSIGWTVVLTIVVYGFCRLYHRVWRFASTREFELCALAVLIVCLLNSLTVPLINHMPLSYFVFGAAFQGVFLIATRFGYRFVKMELARRYSYVESGTRMNAMVIGGGIAAQMIIRELNMSPDSESYVRCAIDDDPTKQNCLIEGVRIVGTRNDILQVARDYKIKKIFFAIPSMPVQDRREILNICKETGAQLLTLPAIYQLANEEVSVSKMREVAISDLLGRPPIQVDNAQILESLRGKVVLVTGGGGSIGSELCRQIAGHSPKQLVIFDMYENNAYDIEQELKRKYGTELNLKVLIGSVRDIRRVNKVFEEYKPEIVFHAAAHKHVPLMETSPCEAIKNNVLGTYKTACAAIANGTKRFVLISTDKAVNPTNIMGASKRLCEMVVQTLDRLGQSGDEGKLPQLQGHIPLAEELRNARIKSPLPAGERTEFVAVRFGNVLGSNGSVIPLFKKQIAAGGPVTVTSPDIIRYFMTIPEAVSLVLQSEAYAKGGEIFVFDMGEPMKIDTLARNLIKLSGYKPDIDIKVVYTGLRPGEKLYEERLMSEEGQTRTENKLISIAKPLEIDVEKFLDQLIHIGVAAYDNDAEMKRRVAEVVETYHAEN